MDLPLVRPHAATRPSDGSNEAVVRSTPSPRVATAARAREAGVTEPTADAVAREAPESRKKPEAEEVERDVEVANELASRMNVAVGFRTFQEDGEVIVEVTNRETGELIRRVPPEDLTDRLTRFQGFEGLLTQAKV